jgi:hypothetical protein
VIRRFGENPKDFTMARPTHEGRELQKGFQTSPRQTMSLRRENACVTLLMASGLALATVVAVAIVSIEVVKAAALH